LLEELAGDGLADLGEEVLPRLVDGGGAREHRLDGYWRDVGTVPSYLDAHLELVQREPPLRLDDPRWPILTANPGGGAAQIWAGAQVGDALLAPGARIGGSVHRSVLSPGVVVEAGAEIIESVLLPGAVIAAGARLHRSIVDNGACVGAGAVVGAASGEPVLIGAGAVVQPGARIEPGARINRSER
jgi:glucose-1-phosphate adenylyltransferase